MVNIEGAGEGAKKATNPIEKTDANVKSDENGGLADFVADNMSKPPATPDVRQEGEAAATKVTAEKSAEGGEKNVAKAPMEKTPIAERTKVLEKGDQKALLAGLDLTMDNVKGHQRTLAGTDYEAAGAKVMKEMDEDFIRPTLGA